MSFEFKYNYPQIARDSGFKLRQYRDGPLDWRLVGSLEVERILREQQFEHIDAILFYLSEAPLASMLESNILDSGIAKYFILSQLAIQYLIFCRKFLDETVRTLRESLVEVDVENVNLKTVNQEHSSEILQLHKKISQIEAINDIVFPCHICTKNFVSNDALNIHLSKKHSKSPTGDIPGKENDRSLINTIKLELEIKHLKERLNIAEKDIRETVENKKASPREVPKMCSSTQINTKTIDVGTQSNLFESKETDCTEEDKFSNVEILSQLQDKISKLESSQEKQRTGNQQSINEIVEKLSEITDSLRSRSKQDEENLKKLANDAILSSISSKQILPTASADELQTILSNTVSEVVHLNSVKLNDILSKIESIYTEKLPSLELEIQKQVKAAMSSTLMTNPLPLNIKEVPFEEVEHSVPNSQRTYSIEKPTPFLPHDAHEDSSTDLSQEILESQGDEEIQQTTISSRSEEAIPNARSQKRVVKSLKKKMTSYGINSATKGLSASDANKISAQLAESRSSLKKVYPKYYATRNRLKNFVDRLSSSKTVDGSFHSVSLPEIFKHSLQDKSVKNPNKIKADVSYHKPSESDKKDAFKNRIEKILNSPIKKPEIFITNNTQEPVKPIPLPRKRVMFSNPDDASTGDEVSVSQKEPKELKIPVQENS